MADFTGVTAVASAEDTDCLLLGGAAIDKKISVGNLKVNNLDGRYAQKGTVIWEDGGGSDLIVLPTPLNTSHTYEVYVNVNTALPAAKMVLKGKPSEAPWITFISINGDALYIYGVGSSLIQIQIAGTIGHHIYKIIDLGAL